ncbi:hypothetical protein [Caudoviricetes sp.]|nr:hypothetical protein [Caudoviricetes sp.]
MCLTRDLQATNTLDMTNAAATRRTNRHLRRSLMAKIEILSAEAAACTTEAAYRCVMQSVEDARRQLREALG